MSKLAIGLLTRVDESSLAPHPPIRAARQNMARGL